MTITTEKKYRYKATPQVSANQISEYLTASPTRRKSIIRDARFPKTAVISQYVKARDGLTTFLGDGTRSMSHLASAIDSLEKRRIKADADARPWLVKDSRYSVEAINAFQLAYNKLLLPKLDCRIIPGRLPAIVRWPTKVTVDIDVTTHRMGKDGAPDQVGGALMLFSRGEPSTARRIDRCKTIAGLILIFAEDYLTTTDRVADSSLCLAVDVFAGKSYPPPGTFAKKAKSIGDACEEIADRWKSVDAPADYDGPDYD